MWNCNGSASPAVFPERRVAPIVTPLAAIDQVAARSPGRIGWRASRAQWPVRPSNRAAAPGAMRLINARLRGPRRLQPSSCGSSGLFDLAGTGGIACLPTWQGPNK